MCAVAKWTCAVLLAALSVAALAPAARANVTVLLEEPYSYDGTFAGTGHTAVYLSRVCAETPVLLRRCAPGEHGVVISRYTRVAGYDWLAIPLVPYLYAVENDKDIPLFADPKVVAFLRDQYRRAHLEEYAPDEPGGATPKGDWYELVGSSYDRTNYGFEIQSTPEQDDAFIAWLNGQPNRARYHFVSRNCADFVREVLNFYYPKSVSRGNIADLFVSTPKHAARALVRYSNRHPEFQFSRFVIPQVPGTVRRSKPVRGVLESLVRAKKYVAVLAVFHPVVAGGVVSVYLVGDRFNPAKNARVFNLDGDPEPALSNQERKDYLKVLNAETDGTRGPGDPPAGSAWKRFVEKAQPELDATGQLALEVRDGSELAEVRITRSDLANSDTPSSLQQDLIVARLKQILSRSRAPRASRQEVRADWQLLDRIEALRATGALQQLGAGTNSATQTSANTSD